MRVLLGCRHRLFRFPTGFLIGTHWPKPISRAAVSTYMYTCEFRHTHTHPRLCMQACLHACMDGRTDVCMYVCTYVCMYVFVCIYIYTYIYVCVCAYVFIYIYTYIHTCLPSRHVGISACASFTTFTFVRCSSSLVSEEPPGLPDA